MKKYKFKYLKEDDTYIKILGTIIMPDEDMNNELDEVMVYDSLYKNVQGDWLLEKKLLVRIFFQPNQRTTIITEKEWFEAIEKYKPKIKIANEKL